MIGIYDLHNHIIHFLTLLLHTVQNFGFFTIMGITSLSLIFNPPHLVCKSCIMSSNCGQIVIKLCEVITVLWLHK